MTLNGEPSDLDTIRNMTALRCRSMFAAQALAANCGVGPAALEKFILGVRLAPEPMGKLVALLFDGKAAWNDATQSLVDIVKPATRQMGAADMPPVATNVPS